MYEAITVAQYLFINMLPGLLLLVPLYFVVRHAVYSGVRRALKINVRSGENET